MRELIYLILCLCYLAGIIWVVRKWVKVIIIQYIVYGLCGLFGGLMVVRFIFKLFGFGSPI